MARVQTLGGVMSQITLHVKITNVELWRMRIGKALLWLATWVMGCGIQFDETGDRRTDDES